MDIPSTSIPTPSPLSSPKQMGGLQIENQKLKRQLQMIQKQAKDKQTQLSEKNEALIDYQIEYVKNTYNFALAMRYKMESLVAIENGQKKLVACQAQLADKDKKV